MEDSIFETVKSYCGAFDTSFDNDILVCINTAVSILEQLGVETAQNLTVDEDTEWDALIVPNVGTNMIRSYICAKVRLLFDPPTSSITMNALNALISEFEWRINIHVDK